MRDTIYYKIFLASLTKAESQEYSQMSINQMKDRYIAYLENNQRLLKTEMKLQEIEHNAYSMWKEISAFCDEHGIRKTSPRSFKSIDLVNEFAAYLESRKEVKS